MVADGDAILRWAEEAADLDVLAAYPPHLPPSDPDPDLAADGGSARSRDLRTFGRCEVGRGRPDLLSGSCEAGRVNGSPSRSLDLGCPMVQRWAASSPGMRTDRRSDRHAHEG